jgi:hypothetical protein
LLQRKADVEAEASTLATLVRGVMLPAEWAERHEGGRGARSKWVEALMRDERGLHMLCSCMLYANFRSRSATHVKPVPPAGGAGLRR